MALCRLLAQTLRPYIAPVLFDVVQTRSAVRFAVNHPPAGWNIGEGRPQAVLLLVVDQDEKVPSSSSNGLLPIGSPPAALRVAVPVTACRSSAGLLQQVFFLWDAAMRIDKVQPHDFS